MGNIIRRHASSEITPRHVPNEGTGFVNMSNGLTGVVLSILAMAMAEEAKTPQQQRLATWIACKDQSVLGMGTISFSLSEMPWELDTFEEDQAFMIRSCERAEAKSDWHRLDYEPREDWAIDRFQTLAKMTGHLLPSEFDGAGKPTALDPNPSGTKCDRHGAFLHDSGCIVCNKGT